MADALNAALPREIGRKRGIVRFLGALVQLRRDGLSHRRLCPGNQSEKFVGIGGNILPEFLHRRRAGVPEGKAVAHALRVDLKEQAGIFRPPLHVLPDAEPQTFLVGVGMVQSGVPVDAADLQDRPRPVEKLFLERHEAGLMQKI